MLRHANNKNFCLANDKRKLMPKIWKNTIKQKIAFWGHLESTSTKLPLGTVEKVFFLLLFFNIMWNKKIEICST